MTPLGSVAFMGLGAPEMMISDVFADPSNSTVMARASTYGYLAMADATTPDFYTTCPGLGDVRYCRGKFPSLRWRF